MSFYICCPRDVGAIGALKYREVTKMRGHCRVALILAIVLCSGPASFGGDYTASIAIVPQSGVAASHESETETELIEVERATGRGVPPTVALGPQRQPPALEKSQATEDDTNGERRRAFLMVILMLREGRGARY